MKLTDLQLKTEMSFEGSRKQLKDWKRAFYAQTKQKDSKKFFEDVIMKIAKFGIRTGSLR